MFVLNLNIPTTYKSCEV